MRRTSLLAAAAIASALAAAPAHAGRHAHAAVSAPKQLDTTHAEFTLPGGPWGQVVGALAGTPAYGRYAYDAQLPSSRCRIHVAVTARSSSRYPRVGRRTVRLRPLSRDSGLLHIKDESRRGAMRWWTGSLRDHDAAAGGVQRMPAQLRSKRRRWLIYDVRVTHGADPSDDNACRTRARKTGARAVRSIVRTLKLADGPPVAEAPFVTA